VDLTVKHLENVRTSTVIFHLTKHLLYSKWRDPGEAPKLYLFGALKRIVGEWLEQCLVCKGDTYPAQILYLELADMACARIAAAITREFQDKRPIKVLLDPYNPTGSTAHVRFATTRQELWDTSGPPAKCHLNRIVLDSDWEAEFCRAAEAHPRVLAYVKNHNLGFEVPYLFGGEVRWYRPDFIALVDDGRGSQDPLHLVVEIKGYRGEDAKEKKATMENYWIPGVNNLKTYGRWAFAEFSDIWSIGSDLQRVIQERFEQILNRSRGDAENDLSSRGDAENAETT
jgi:type III restriction enzyme